MSDTKIVIKPREALKSYLSRKERYACLVIHRRFGKTFGCIQDITIKALTHKRDNMKTAPLRYAYIAPTRDQAKDVAWGYIKEFLGQIKGARVNESDLKCTVPIKDKDGKATYAEIRLYSGDNYERMRGLYFDGVVLDEYADINPAAWATVIRPCLSDYRGWATFIGTPKGKNAFYDVYKNADSSDNWYCLYLPASKSGILSEEELLDIQEDPNITRNQYLQEYECDFDIASPGTIFLEEVEQARKQSRISSDIMHFAGQPVYTTFDIGLPMNTKCWIWQLVGDKIKLLQAISGHAQLNTPHKWVDLLKQLASERGYSYGVHFLPHDGETVWLPILKDAGFANVECLKRPKDQWDTINTAIKLFPRMFFNQDECAEGIRALEFWSSRKVDKKQYYTNQPVHDWASHWGTAFAYAAWAIELGRAIGNAGQQKRGRRGSGVRVRMGGRDSFHGKNNNVRVIR